MKYVIVVILAAFIVGCASQPPKIAKTLSGMPEMLIATTDRQAVRQNIIGRNVADGWTLEQETDSLLLFKRPFDEKTAIFGAALIGAQAMVRGKTIRYTIVQTQGGTKVLVAPFNEYDSAEFNALYTQLQAVKRDIEK